MPKMFRKLSFDTLGYRFYLLCIANGSDKVYLIGLPKNVELDSLFKGFVLSHKHNAATLCHWRYSNIDEIFNGLSNGFGNVCTVHVPTTAMTTTITTTSTLCTLR